uniref:NADH dehydrogenase subunit 6 n=1 Tax=Malassezia cuniculi TaxID=948313 RepID=UPI003003A517|nr:NADH dehydrogenase subunit 6 [Malassezia cuniculi]
MTSTTFFIEILSLGAIFSALLVVTSKNPAVSVLFLITLFLNVSGYLVLQGLGFVGISYLILYIGAIAILFLFVVMMLNIHIAELNAITNEYNQNMPLGMFLVFLLFVELFSFFPFKSNGQYLNVNPFKIFSDIQVGFLNTLNTIVESIGFGTFFNSTNVYQTFNISPDSNFSSLLDVQSIGFTLYTFGSIWLFVASFILLLAMIGPIVLTLTSPNNK